MSKTCKYLGPSAIWTFGNSINHIIYVSTVYTIAFCCISILSKDLMCKRYHKESVHYQNSIIHILWIYSCKTFLFYIASYLIAFRTLSTTHVPQGKCSFPRVVTILTDPFYRLFSVRKGFKLYQFHYLDHILQ